MQSQLEERLKAFEEVDKVFYAQDQPAQMAAVAPDVADNCLSSARSQWPNPNKTKDELVAEMAAAVEIARQPV